MFQAGNLKVIIKIHFANQLLFLSPARVPGLFLNYYRFVKKHGCLAGIPNMSVKFITPNGNKMGWMKGFALMLVNFMAKKWKC